MELLVPTGSLAIHLAAIARGERTLPDSSARRHHFVPQMLLRRFTTPAVSGDPKIFKLDKTDGTIEEVTTRGAGWERELYAVITEEGRNRQVEGLLSVVEDHASNTIDRLLTSTTAPDLGDRWNLAVFLELQETRTPAALAEAREALRHMGIIEATVALTNAHGKRERVREMREALLNGSIMIEPTHGFTLSMMFRPVAEVAGVIAEMPWVLWRAREGEFVLSDRPLTRHDPKPPHKFSAAGWASSEVVYTTLPLSPAFCLRISPTGSEPFRVVDVTRLVEKTNLRTYGWATRYVFARSIDVLADLHALAAANPDLVETPVPKRLVILEDEATAGPRNDEVNNERGFPTRIFHTTEQGPERLSYRVIDSIDDAREVMMPPGLRKPAPDDPGRST